MVNFQINQLYLTYTWKWNLQEDICGICQQSFDQMCPDCKHPYDCKPCIGTCDHSYHIHCLQSWLAQKKFCPMCRLAWKYKKIFE